MVAGLVYLGFQQSQQNATERSAIGLAEQGRDALLKFTIREAEITNLWLQQASASGTVAADYMVDMRALKVQVPWSIDRLTTAAGGQLYDPNPNRRTEVWVGSDTDITPELARDLQDSAVFDALFPELMTASSNAIAIYYMSPTGAGRYYPVVDLINRLEPDFSITEQPFYTLATPEANPDKAVVWSPPYVDFVGLGPIVTSSTPVYENDIFRGVVSVDISLTTLINRLNSLAPSPGSYAFLIDENNDLIAASPRALEDLLGSSVANTGTHTITETLGLSLANTAKPQVLAAVDQIWQQVSGVEEIDLGGSSKLLAYAWLPTVNWKLGIVTPLVEITAQSKIVDEAIQQDATKTVRATLILLTIIFLVALFLSAFINNRLIVQRVETLAAGTQAIAAGDFAFRIPVSGDDELDQLADSFNQMASQLAVSRDELEERVAQRTRELAALYDVTAVASASLDLHTLLNQALAHVLAAMECTAGAIHLYDEESQALKMIINANLPKRDEGDQTSWDEVLRLTLTQDEPISVLDLRSGDNALFFAAGLQTYIGVPLRTKGKMLGVLSLFSATTRQFTAEDKVLMISFGDQIGIAAENALLYQQAEEVAVIQERQRLARELHDAVTQSVYSATLLAATGQRAASAGDWQQVKNFLRRLQTITNQALKELRLLVFEMRPAALQDAGLVEALQHRLDAVEQRAGIRAQLFVENDFDLSEEQETALYRIAIEALNNALKHANATNVRLRLTRQNETVVLVIQDNGQGFDSATIAERSGIGMESMRERARRFGGQVLIESEPGEGTIVTIRLGMTSQGENI